MFDMELFMICLALVSITLVAGFIGAIMVWYNGVLEVRMDEDGDDLKLNINEYDMIRNRKLMILLIKRK